jgi:hypothetical protein
MKVFSILLSSLVVGAYASLENFNSERLKSVLGNFDGEWGLFENFRHEFPRVYNSFEELEHRFGVFRDNLRTIIEHNNGNHTFVMGVNRFSDFSSNEYIDFVEMGGYSRENSWKLKCNDYSENGRETVDEIDWRNEGVVNTPRDQGNAGTCWAFSATTSVESAYAIESGSLYDLSEQQLVDCDKRSAGTNGGSMDTGMIYLISNDGQCVEDSYPYTATDTECHECNTIVPVYDCFEIEEGNELAMKEILNQQPVSVAIDASSREFQHYSSGVISSSDCYKELNHGVAVVGYGEDNGQKYWIVKNSWGTSYGMDGYVWIGRTDDVDNEQSSCGIAMSVSYPQVTSY